MADMGKQLQGGISDVGRALTSDVVKGVGEVGKKVIEDTLDTGIEALSGGVLGEGDDQRLEQMTSEDIRRRREAAEREKAARRRLQELQAELRQVVASRQQEAVAQDRVDEQQRAQAEQVEEGSRKKRLFDLFKKASRGGGTGEVTRQKN